MNYNSNYINSKLDEFIDFAKPENKCLLLSGERGIGKTYLVDKWLEDRNEFLNEQSIVPIKVNLVGVSSIGNLFESLNKQIGKVCKTKVRSFTLGAKIIGFEFYIKLEFEKMLKKIIYKKKKKILFIIDDIERKDYKLTTREILGAVNSLPNESKTILISNTSQLSDEKDFNLFKEKVIQKEIELVEPTEEAIEKLLNKSYYDLLKSKGIQISNLRIVKRMNNFLKCLESYSPEVFRYLYYACVYINERTISKDTIIKMIVDEEKHQYYHNREDDVNIDSIKAKINDYSDKKLFVQYVVLMENKFFNKVIEAEIEEIYEIVKKDDLRRFEEFSKRKNIDLKIVSNDLLPNLLLSNNYDESYLKFLKEIIKIIKSDEYEVMGVLYLYARGKYSYSYYKKEAFHTINELAIKIEKEFAIKIASYLFDYADYFDNSVEKILAFDVCIQKEILDILRAAYQICCEKVNEYILGNSDCTIDTVKLITTRCNKFMHDINKYSNNFREEHINQQLDLDRIFLKICHQFSSRNDGSIDSDEWRTLIDVFDMPFAEFKNGFDLTLNYLKVKIKQSKLEERTRWEVIQSKVSKLVRI